MESIKKNEDFRLCYKKGKSCADRLLVIYYRKNGLDRSRLGISVSKKVGNSVVRHRLCRLVREAYRLHEKTFDSGSDIVVVARRSADSANYHEIETALINLLRRSGICHEVSPQNKCSESET